MDSDNSIKNINDINEIMEKYTQFHNLKEIVETNITDNQISQPKSYEQHGGLLGPVVQAFQACIGIVFKVVFGIFIWFKKLMIQLFHPFPYKQKNRAQFYKYIWFCIKCGFYLIIFAIAGPVFVMIGIFMVYGKIFQKMGVSGPELVRERIAAARQT